MPLPVIAGVTRAFVTGQLPNGRRWGNVLHFRFTGTGAPAGSDLNTLETKIAKLYGGPAYTSGRYVLQSPISSTTVDTIYLLPLDGVTAATKYTVTLTGGGSLDPLPPETAPVVSFGTGLRGPRHRGRSYLPAFGESDNVSQGTMISSDATGLIANYQAWQTDLETSPSTWEHVVASYKHADWALVTAYTVSVIWKSQRRRRGR